MAKSKKESLSKGKATPDKPKPKKEEPEKLDDELDFGGFPKDVDLNRNMGCGG